MDDIFDQFERQMEANFFNEQKVDPVGYHDTLSEVETPIEQNIDPLHGKLDAVEKSVMDLNPVAPFGNPDPSPLGQEAIDPFRHSPFPDALPNPCTPEPRRFWREPPIHHLNHGSPKFPKNRTKLMKEAFRYRASKQMSDLWCSMTQQNCLRGRDCENCPDLKAFVYSNIKRICPSSGFLVDLNTCSCCQHYDETENESCRLRRAKEADRLAGK